MSKKSMEDIIDRIFDQGKEDETYKGEEYLEEDMSRDSLLNDVFSDYFENHIEDETFVRDEALDDNHINETLEKYNYNYRRLMKRVTVFMDDNKLKEALEECEISENEYNNPTPEIFERMRNYVINRYRKTR